MKLTELITFTPHLAFFGRDTEISSIVYDTREASGGSLLFCLKGEHIDRHDYALMAYDAGCRAFVAEHRLPLPSDAAQLIVPNARYALADISDAFYGFPAKHMTLIGITGTKGKTTVAMMTVALLQKAGLSVGYIGSLGAFCRGKWVKTENTTPESSELRHLLSEMLDCGVKVLILEISSQSVSVGRIRGLRFPICVLTNLSYDHVGNGEHENLPAYFEAKRELFLYHHCEKIIYYCKDNFASNLLSEMSSDKIKVGDAEKSDYYARTPTETKIGESLAEAFTLHRLNDDYPLYLPLPGKFNVTNALLSLATADSVCRKLSLPVLSLPSAASVFGTLSDPGRLRTYLGKDGRYFIIDYAHNAKSMESLLRMLRSYTPSRLTVLFGSVGGRSRSRRAELGRTVSEFADFAVITSDNPASEAPNIIADDIRSALGKTPSVTLLDRRDAVFYAVNHSVPGEFVALCGKGSECYQTVGDRKIAYSEEKNLLDAMASAVWQ